MSWLGGCLARVRTMSVVGFAETCQHTANERVASGSGSLICGCDLISANWLIGAPDTKDTTMHADTRACGKSRRKRTRHDKKRSCDGTSVKLAPLSLSLKNRIRILDAPWRVLKFWIDFRKFSYVKQGDIIWKTGGLTSQCPQLCKKCNFFRILRRF